jgi:hypothetical protein
VSAGVENFTNVITVIAALGGVGIAGFGLFTWKTQATWNIDSNLAKSILVLLFKHNDALKNVRFFAITSGEIEEATKGMELPRDDRLRRYRQDAAVYQARWKKVQELRSELYPLVIEGQALWGMSFKDRFKPLWKLESELWNAVRLYIEQLNPDYTHETQREFAKMRREKRDVLYLADEDQDSFTTDYLNELRPIEDFLRQKLGRKQ